jgi:TonB-dependent starch-binding outer membrane protein SusC
MAFLPLGRWPLTGTVALLTNLSLLPGYAQTLASSRRPESGRLVEQQQQVTPAPAPAAVAPVLLSDLLRGLESEFQVMILYDSELVGATRVAPPAAGTLEERLEVVLRQAALEYEKVRDKYYVVVTPNAPHLTVPTTTASATAPQDDITVAGRVTQANGEALPGVTVRVKGGTTGTATDADGRYSLTVPAGSKLVFSYIGFMSKEVEATVAGASFDIVLDADAQALNEVVVVGYGTQNRRELTTSVVSVGARAIERQPVAGFDQALQGQAAGVQVSAPSGAPGAGINIQIRGISTVNLNSSPLYVIDGVPVLPTYDREIGVGNQRPNPLNTLNPADIESIDILKDGAAAAIYGLRASNGVVVITTKHGKAGKAQVTFSTYVGVQKIRNKIDLLNSSQFSQLYNEGLVNAGLNPVFTPAQIANPKYNTDWQDEIYRQASIQNYQIGVSGGTEKTRYYASGGYFKQTGISINSGFDRYNFKLNLDQQVGNRFRFGTNLNLSRTNTNGSVRSELPLGSSGTVLGALAQIPTVPVRDSVGNYGVNTLNQSDNPVGNLQETSNLIQTYQAIGNTYGELSILPNLQLRSSVGIDFRSQLENEFISRDYPGTLNSAEETRGSSRTGNTLQTIWLWENTLTYNPTLGEKHNLTLLAGQSTQASDRFTSNASVRGFASNLVQYQYAATTRLSTSTYNEQWGLMSYFARAVYNYDERYLATLSVRADGSSRFGDENKFGYFPAVGLGWRVSKESFLRQNQLISDLKLRGSFGVNGNQEIPIYGRFSTYDTGRNYGNATGTISSGVSPGAIGNADVKWETTYQSNVGVDFGMFSGRLTLTVDAYRKHTKNLLYSVPIPLSTGAGSLEVIQNLAESENKGVEVSLTSTNVQSANDGGFGWTTNFNASMNRNKILDLGQIPSLEGGLVDRELIGGYSIQQKGQPLGSFYGYKTQGIFQSDAEVAAAPFQTTDTHAGDIRFVDTNGDGKIDDNDRTIIGNPNPKLVAGITNTLTYKGLELSFLFYTSVGNDIYNENLRTIEGMSDPVNQTTRVLNHWTPTNTNTDIPRPYRGDRPGNNRFSDRFLEDGSYVRLKNLTVAYNLPISWISRAKMSALRIYATGQNLITWTDYTGYDPEVNADPLSTTGFGRDFGVYPQARTYTLGLNATF